MIRSLCAGASFAKMLVVSAASASAASLIPSIAAPSSTRSPGIPTRWQMYWVMISLSPVSTFTATCRPSSSVSASSAVAFGGSRNARKPEQRQLRLILHRVHRLVRRSWHLLVGQRDHPEPLGVEPMHDRLARRDVLRRQWP